MYPVPSARELCLSSQLRRAASLVDTFCFQTADGAQPVRRAAHASRPWGLDGPPGATGVLSGRGGRKRGPLTRSNFEVMHLMQGCHCALLQKLCKMPKSQTLDP